MPARKKAETSRLSAKYLTEPSSCARLPPSASSAKEAISMISNHT